MLLRTGFCLMLVSLCAVLACSKREMSVASQKQANWLGVDSAALASAEDMPAPKILPETYFAAAQLLEAQGRWEEAIQQYRRATLTNHQFVAAYHRLGLALSHVRRYDEAIVPLERAVMLRPDVPILYNNLGFAYAQAQRYNDAELAFEEALKLEPGFARAHINLAMTLARQGRFDAAYDHFAAVLPESAVQYNLGVMYRGQDRIEEAALAFVRALELDPGMTAAARQLETCVAELGPIHLTEPLAQIVDDPTGSVITDDDTSSATDFDTWPTGFDDQPCEDGTLSDDAASDGFDTNTNDPTSPADGGWSTSGGASGTSGGYSTTPSQDADDFSGSESSNDDWNAFDEFGTEDATSFDSGNTGGSGFDSGTSASSSSGGWDTSSGPGFNPYSGAAFGGSSSQETGTAAPTRFGWWAWLITQSRQNPDGFSPATSSPDNTWPAQQSGFDNNNFDDDTDSQGGFGSDGSSEDFEEHSNASDMKDLSGFDTSATPDGDASAADDGSTVDTDTFGAFVLYPSQDRPAVTWANAEIAASTPSDEESWAQLDADLGAIWSALAESGSIGSGYNAVSTTRTDGATPSADAVRIAENIRQAQTSTGSLDDGTTANATRPSDNTTTAATSPAQHPTPPIPDTLRAITGTPSASRGYLLEPLATLRSDFAGPWPTTRPAVRPLRWADEQAARIAYPTPQR